MPSEPIEESLSFMFVLVVKAYRDQVANSIRELGLYQGQELVLTRLWNKDGVTLSEFAAGCGLEPPTITKVLDRMSRNKLVHVEPDPNDRRVRRVYLTEKGRALKVEVRERWHAAEKQLLKNFNDKERADLRDYFEKMYANVSSDSRGPNRESSGNTKTSKGLSS